MKKIKSTEEAWDNGSLGESEKHAVVVEGSGKSLDDALGLQMISIRLDKRLIDDLKLIAKINGIGYQPLIRGHLQKFAECELKNIGRQTLECKIESHNEREQPAAKIA